MQKTVYEIKYKDGFAIRMVSEREPLDTVITVVSQLKERVE